MIIYFASGSTVKKIVLDASADVLETFFTPNNVLKFVNDPAFKARLFLDSGAFSAFTLAKKFDIQKYAEFIRTYRARLTIASNLDVIGDWKGTKKNQELLESMGVEVLPVYHANEPIEVLQDYASRYSYIAVGGLVPLTRKRQKMKMVLDRVFSIVRDKTRVHAFGLNATWAWQAFPFYSVDATSWLSGGIFVQLFPVNRMDFYRCIQNSEMENEHLSALRQRLGITKILIATIFLLIEMPQNLLLVYGKNAVLFGKNKLVRSKEKNQSHYEKTDHHRQSYRSSLADSTEFLESKIEMGRNT